MIPNLAVTKPPDNDLPPLIRKLSYLQPLNSEEIAVLMKMHINARFIDEHKVFLNQGDTHKKCFIVTQGWAYRFSDLSNGTRQVINFYLPGDIISPFALVMPKATYSIASITQLQVCVYEPEYLIELFSTQPKLGLLYGCILGREDSTIAEQIVRIGRRSAYQRTAHLLLELFHRLKIIGETENKTFSMPVSQQLLADTLGLSIVHMNRTLSRLRHDGLISIQTHEVKLLNVDNLKLIAEYESYYLDQIKKLSLIIDNDIDKT